MIIRKETASYKTIREFEKEMSELTYFLHAQFGDSSDYDEEEVERLRKKFMTQPIAYSMPGACELDLILSTEEEFNGLPMEDMIILEIDCVEEEEM